MTRDGKWHEKGNRMWWAENEDFEAVIFGSNGCPRMWAFAVWMRGETIEGIAFSLRSARNQANDAIGRARRRV
jgi:hypothetical protein